MITCTDKKLAAVAEKLCAGDRLDQADGEVLLATRDIHTLGRLADDACRARHGDVAYYNVNRHINYTNVCVLRCKFCAFRRGPGGEGAYELSNEEIAEIAQAAAAGGATEVHVTGGLHPQWGVEHYEQMLAGIRRAAPDIHIKAFTAVEIAHFARLGRTTPADVLARLIAAGLASMPGGGAEIFDPTVHHEAFAGKIGSDDWFDIHRIAHGLGLRTNATMLYGHIETHAQRVDHLLKLRALQDATGGLQCIVPLSFQPAGTELARQHDLPGPTGLDDLRTIATTRLLADNVPHVKSFWVMHGIKLAQLALDWGADDIDGTVVRYDITHDVVTGARQEVSIDALRALIAETGRTPVERDSLYRSVSL